MVIVAGCSSTGTADPIGDTSLKFPTLFPTKKPVTAKNVISPTRYFRHLLNAIERDDAQFVKTSLQSTPSLLSLSDHHGNSLLNIAALHRSYRCISVLIELGADINKQDSFGDSLADLSYLDGKIKMMLGEIQ